MILNCKNILTLPYVNQLVMVAGENGKNNIITDTHVVEEMSLLEFVAEGELIFSMGCSLKGEIDKWLAFAEETYDRGASGLVICLGLYLQITPQSLIELCDDLDYPLFELRYEIRISNVIHSIYRAMFREEFTKQEMSRFFDDIIEGQVSCNPRKIKRAAGYSFDNTAIYEMITLRIIDYDYELVDVKKDNLMVCEYDYLDRLSMMMQSYVDEKWKNVIIFRRDPDLVFLLPKNGGRLTDFVDSLDLYLKENGISVAIAAGVQFEGLVGLAEAYKKVERLIDNDDFTYPQIRYYKDLKLKTILYEVNDNDMLYDLVDRSIGEILMYDKSDVLYESLKAYIHNNCNMEEAARSLFIHQNTLRYRLDKLENIIGKSLKDFDTLYDIKMAIEIYEHISES